MANLLPVAVLTAALLVLSASAFCTAYAQVDYPELGIRVETFADGLRVPWSMDWLPDGTAIFTERSGDLRMIRDGVLVPEPLLSLDVGGAEGGLLGVAVDPDFEDNDHIYVYYTYASGFSIFNKIARYQYADGQLAGEQTILDKIPGSAIHDGGRIQFGPDDMLYASTGDAANPGLSQDRGSTAGKILRIAGDGSIPADNPWENSPVYSLGHRNPQGMDWDREGRLVATEHGPSGWQGTGHDEINIIVPGGNYGWPDVVGSGDERDGFVAPILHTGGSTWAPSGAEFYDESMIPEWDGKYFVATLYGRSLQMIEIDPEGATSTSLFTNQFGRLRDVQTGPDGLLYVLTSNRDGRGQPSPGDDRILRIVPLYDAAGPDGMPHQTQQLKVYSYNGEGGPLEAALRHPGYKVSPITFDLQEKSLSFEFEETREGGSLSVRIERPLISPPFAVTVQDDGNRAAVHDADITYGQDYYVIRMSPDHDSGRIVIMGTHVVPEYGAMAVVMVASVAAASAAAVLVRLSPRLSL